MNEFTNITIGADRGSPNLKAQHQDLSCSPSKTAALQGKATACFMPGTLGRSVNGKTLYKAGPTSAAAKARQRNGSGPFQSAQGNGL